MERVIERTWAARNINLSAVLIILVGSMFGAFWVQYNSERQERIAVNARQDEQLQDLNTITFNLAQKMIDNEKWKDKTDEKLDKATEQYIEVLKQLKRSGYDPAIRKYTEKQ